MWDKPHVLNRISAWLFLAAGLSVGLVATRALTEGLYPFRQVTVLGARHSETKQALTEVIRGLTGGFFSLDLETARQAIEGVPWVHQATVRRIWPNRLLVEVRERIPAASWNGQQVLDVYGELFPVHPWPGLPRIHAPSGMEREVARRLADFNRLLLPAGWHIASVQVSPRRAWRIVLLDGTSLDLGRERLAERVRRFVTFYPAAVASAGPLTEVDLRYPNGFAARRQRTEDRGPIGPLSAVSCPGNTELCLLPTVL